MLKVFLFILPIFMTTYVNADTLADAKAIESDSQMAAEFEYATAARAKAGCGFDYACDANGNKIDAPVEKKKLEPMDAPKVDMVPVQEPEKKESSKEPETTNNDKASEATVADGTLRGMTGHGDVPKAKPKSKPKNQKIVTAVDPFASNPSMDKKYVSKPASITEEDFVEYSGTSEEELMMAAAGNKKAARIEKERQEAAAAAAAENDELNMIFGAITTAVVNNAVNNAIGGGTKKPTTTTTTTTSAASAPEYQYQDNSTWQPKNSKAWNQAQGILKNGW